MVCPGSPYEAAHCTRCNRRGHLASNCLSTELSPRHLAEEQQRLRVQVLQEAVSHELHGVNKRPKTLHVLNAREPLTAQQLEEAVQKVVEPTEQIWADLWSSAQEPDSGTGFDKIEQEMQLGRVALRGEEFHEAAEHY